MYFPEHHSVNLFPPIRGPQVERIEKRRHNPASLDGGRGRGTGNRSRTENSAPHHARRTRRRALARRRNLVVALVPESHRRRIPCGGGGDAAGEAGAGEGTDPAAARCGDPAEVVARWGAALLEEDLRVEAVAVSDSRILARPPRVHRSPPLRPPLLCLFLYLSLFLSLALTLALALSLPPSHSHHIYIIDKNSREGKEDPTEGVREGA